MRSSFDNALTLLRTEMLKMSSMAEAAIARAVLSLKEQDVQLAEQVIAMDDEVDDMELSIEDTCLKLITLQHPVAGDLRIIISVLKICTDIERLADLATNIAEVTLRIGDSPLIKPLEDIPKMADAVQLMVRESLEAFVSRDECKAREVCLSDDAVDRMYSDLHDELMGYMTSSHDPRCVEQAANLLFVARQLERIADHATNIGDRVIYMVTGKRDSY